ncbi:uncharacterized protein LOC113335583 [Papaver somniferum]|uniref:uncharacterized protein LOC113335583 n=1 Tax=Papaver somniferum TaxID=3469 RepID=UPI000E700414|nr:uncharacterized protein LOC113335583 [Papaver somniferum]
MFFRNSAKGTVLLLLYVDDMVITGSDSEGIKSLKTHLNLCFQMKDLGHLRYFLGMEVDRSSKGYFISQVKYASEILNRAGLTDSKILETPLELNVKLNPIDGKALSDPTLYRQLVWSLNYLTIIRPDISYAVHVVSQFMSAPRTTHFAAILSILLYIKGTLYQGLQFSSKSDLRLHAYTDSDWAGHVTDRRSTSGYYIFLGNSLISLRIKKKSVVSRSSAEAEYMAMAHTTSEIVWLRWLLSDMGIHLAESTPLYCDNKAAIHIAHNDVFHERTKHIEINFHFIRHHFKKKTITLPLMLHVPMRVKLVGRFMAVVKVRIALFTFSIVSQALIQDGHRVVELA